jgi:hypothetical protein
LLNSYPFAIEYHKCEHGGCISHKKCLP